MNEHDLRERKEFLEGVETFLNKSDFLTVLSLAESRLKRTPDDLDARMVICRVWIEQGRLEEAGEMLREMEDILAGLSQIYTFMGDVYLKKGMPESAEVFYRIFLNLNPDTPMAREISERLKDITTLHEAEDAAGEEQGKVLQVPDQFHTVTLAELYIRQGHLQMAEEVLAAILREGPYHAKAAEMLRQVRENIVKGKEPLPVLKLEPEPELKREPEPLPEVGPKPVRQLEPVPGHKPEPEPVTVIQPVPLPEPMTEPVLKLEPQMAPEPVTQPKLEPEPVNPHAAVIAELSRWLNNIDRLRRHAA